VSPQLATGHSVADNHVCDTLAGYESTPDDIAACNDRRLGGEHDRAFRCGLD
jgi:hypothetical protein